jgi:glycolate oxidase FAD binding subunit
VRAATADDAVAGVQPKVVVEPTTEEEVAAILAYADAEGLKVLVRGGGTQLGMGHPPTGGDILLSTRGLATLVEHEPGDMTATAEAGMTLADFQAELGRAGQWLALDPALPPATTIGGIVATAVSGAHRLRYGGVRDQIIGVRIVRADGTIAKGGGKVVKNVAGFDLPKLFTGSLGTLGVIVSATFRLYPKAASASTVLLHTSAYSPLCNLAVKLLNSTLVPSTLTISGSTDADACVLAVRFEGSATASEAQASEVGAFASGLGGNAEILAGDEEVDYWRAVVAGPVIAASATDTIRLKVSLLPTTILPWLATLRDRAARLAIAGAWIAHAGHGLVDLRFTGEPAALRAIVADLRAAAVAHGGSLVVTDAPPAILNLVDPWGASPALAIMRRVKEQFDPHATLNPGRFVGGI